MSGARAVAAGSSLQLGDQKVLVWGAELQTEVPRTPRTPIGAPLDDEDPEAGKAPAPADHDAEPADDRTPEALFDRSWALLVIQRALERLEEEYRSRGRGRAFELLKPYLAGGHDAPHEELARQLAIDSRHLNIMIYRLRRQLGDASVVNPAAIIERRGRSGELRLGALRRATLELRGELAST